MDATEKPRNRQPSPPVHVGVVGAGLAGLRCADILSQYGFRVTLIEGRDRVGGRICQAPIQGTSFLADMGANWIHGTETNPILEIAKQKNAQFAQWEDTPYVLDEAGKPLENTQSEQLSSLMWSMLMDALDYSDKNWAHIDQNQSVWDYLQQKLPEKIPETETNYGTKRKVLLQMAESWGAYVGSPVHRQSLRFMWLEECLEGENLFCASTYKPILESIAAPVLSHVREIRYNTVIEKIKGKSQGSNKVLLSSAQEENFEFDEVVLTTPLGWLKRHHQTFDPPLPERLTRAIEAMGYGCLEKVYITFRDSFWSDKDAQGRRCKGFIQWLAPKYASQSNPRRWIQEAVELGSTAAPYGHPTLLFYIYGEQSAHITSALQKLSTKAERDSFLATWFKPYYSRMPGYDESSARCEVVNCLATDWLHDELAGNGSYTNFQVGVVEGNEDVKALRNGVPEKGLWLAGEHTAPFIGLGTATGAYWSGEAVANRIADKYGLRGDHREAAQ